MSNIHTLAEYRDGYGENLPFNRSIKNNYKNNKMHKKYTI